MGEHKLPETPPKPPKRPTADIIGMRSSISGWESQVMGSDQDTNDFMRALRNVMKWVDELETATDPFAKIVPEIPSDAADDCAIELREVGGSIYEAQLTVGDFRRLNPAAVAAAAAKLPLNS